MSPKKVTLPATVPLANQEPHSSDQTQPDIVRTASPGDSSLDTDIKDNDIEETDKRDTKLKSTTRNLVGNRAPSTPPSIPREEPESSSLSDAPSSEDMEHSIEDLAVTAPKGNRANRQTKPFVNSSKDPRVVSTESITNARKRRLSTPLHPPPAKRIYTTPQLGLPFNTIKSINMPPRIGLVAGETPPAPIDGTFPFGDTEDHQNSMLIHFLDELEYTYGEATGLYNNAFPKDQITDEAIRRRHLRSLERLLARYGPKPVGQIGPVGKKILRRGKPRATRLSDIAREGDATPSPDDSPTTAGTSVVPPARRYTQSKKTLRYRTTIEALQKKRSMKNHHFEKACIVVWRDTDNMEFKAIRERLEDHHNWSIGTAAVKKLYYDNRHRVHGTNVEDAHGDEDGEGEDEVTVGEDVDMDGDERDVQICVTAMVDDNVGGGAEDDDAKDNFDVDVDAEDDGYDSPPAKRQCVEKV